MYAKNPIPQTGYRPVISRLSTPGEELDILALHVF
jgi:hypothetical protein